MTDSLLFRVERLEPGDAPSLGRQLLELYDERVLEAPSDESAPLDVARRIAAVAFCLAYDTPLSDQWQWLRLAALMTTLAPEAQAAVLRRIQDDAGRQRVADLLKDSVAAQDPALTSAADVLHFARAAAERPGDPLLAQVTRPVGLVYGGATKIKQYVFESARIPEIRGASSLLDRINLLDLPALWGQAPSAAQWSPGYLAEAQPRYQAVRDRFHARTGHAAPVAPECIVYAHGGNLLAFAPVALMNDLADEIERTYTEQTLTANSVAVARALTLSELVRGYPPTLGGADLQAPRVLEAYRTLSGRADLPDLSSRAFGEWVTRLEQAADLRRAGNGGSGRKVKPAPVFELPPHARRCSSCDRRAAIFQDGDRRAAIFPDRNRYYCESCRRKVVFGRMTKRNTPEARKQVQEQHRAFAWQPEVARSWFDVFVAERAQATDLYPPQDLGEIGDRSKPKGYIGLIYADVNGLGQFIHGAGTPEEYAYRARRVYRTMRAAVFDALGQHLDLTGPYYPFEILSIGGDDVIVIVPGQYALGVAHAIARNVERSLADWGGAPAAAGPAPNPHRYAAEELRRPDDHPGISLSAGVVIAQDHTPFLFLRDLAEELLASAKTKARDLRGLEPPYRGGTIDFTVLKATSMFSSDVQSYRAAALTTLDRSTHTRNRLTMRPYTLVELEGLMKGVAELKKNKVPRSQLHLLRQDVLDSRMKSILNFLYFEKRHAEEGKVVRDEVLTRWDLGGTPPWRPEQDRVAETPWLDLIEIYDFVPER